MITKKEDDKTEVVHCKHSLSIERVENARKSLAKALNLIESIVEPLRWACEKEEWNDEVTYQIEEAATKLGYALATLTGWNDALGEG